MRKTKKMLLVLVSIALVCCISISGTLAYLQASSAEVVNTFVAVPGIIPGPAEENFYLNESKASLSNGAYILDSTSKVTANSYERVVPGMEIPKDPAVTVNVEDGVAAYVFVKVVDSTNGNLSYTVDSSSWTAVSGVNGVYAYKSTVLGTAATELSAVKILSGDQVKAAANLSAGAENALGTLSFQAYVCQASGFDSAAAAWAACFGG